MILLTFLNIKDLVVAWTMNSPRLIYAEEFNCYHVAHNPECVENEAVATLPVVGVRG